MLLGLLSETLLLVLVLLLLLLLLLVVRGEEVGGRVGA